MEIVPRVANVIAINKCYELRAIDNCYKREELLDNIRGVFESRYIHQPIGGISLLCAWSLLPACDNDEKEEKSSLLIVKTGGTPGGGIQATELTVKIN